MRSNAKGPVANEKVSELNGRPMSGAVLGEISGTAVQQEGASLFYANHGIQGSKVRDFRRREALVAADNHTPKCLVCEKLNVGQG